MFDRLRNFEQTVKVPTAGARVPRIRRDRGSENSQLTLVATLMDRA